jgi:hypothetical protein
MTSLRACRGARHYQIPAALARRNRHQLLARLEGILRLVRAQASAPDCSRGWVLAGIPVLALGVIMCGWDRERQHGHDLDGKRAGGA